jgi:hypothetical protein
MVNLKFEIAKLQNKYVKLMNKPITLVGNNFYIYEQNYLFSVKDEPIKKVILRIFEHFLFSNPSIDFNDRGIAYELLLTTNTCYRLRLVLVGSSILYYYGPKVNDFIILDSEKLDILGKTIWPLDSDGSIL